MRICTTPVGLSRTRTRAASGEDILNACEQILACLLYYLWAVYTGDADDGGRTDRTERAVLTPTSAKIPVEHGEVLQSMDGCMGISGSERLKISDKAGGSHIYT